MKQLIFSCCIKSNTMNDIKEEIWKKHKSGYWVSSFGRIKGQKVEYLKSTMTNGYEMSSLGLLHRIIVETFIGEIPKDREVNHIDHIKTNNRLDNLEIVTRSENQKKAYLTGKSIAKKGVENSQTQLTNSDVINMYSMIKNGKTNLEIGEKYHLHDKYVSLIRHGKRWAHLWVDYFHEPALMSPGNNLYDLETMFKILDEVILNKSNNREIAERYNIDTSVISRLRAKKTWKSVWREYLKEKQAATTIESTTQNLSDVGSE